MSPNFCGKTGAWLQVAKLLPVLKISFSLSFFLICIKINEPAQMMTPLTRYIYDELCVTSGADWSSYMRTSC